MFQISDSVEFSRLIKAARDVMPAPGKYTLNKDFKYVYYLDAAKVVGASFFPFLQHVGVIHDTRTFQFLMLDPDPVDYYFRHFRKYPAYTLSIEDSIRDYNDMLHADPNNSPAGAVGYTGELFAIFPNNLNWFISANRDIDVATVGSAVEIDDDFPHAEFMSEAEIKQSMALLSRKPPRFD